MARQASAIISYSQESDDHNERVRALADRLRGDGIDCVIDAYEVSPPEGWPGWMRRQLVERDFVIVICTETYARRFSGDELPGTGKGAVWEGQLLRQQLYEASKNARVIPVVFDRADVAHIPLELKGATRYDVSTGDGYERLHRALTGQPLVQPAPLGSVRLQLPALTLAERDCMSVLAMCPAPLPGDVIAAIARCTTAEIGIVLKRLLNDGFVAVDSDSSVRLVHSHVGGEDRFDVQAKLPDGATANQVPEMLQRLLTERFELKTHREKRELPVYALEVGKPSARLTENKSGGPTPSHEALTNLALTFTADGVFANLGNESSYTFSRKGRFEAKKLPMPLVAAILERFSDRAVLDMTGLVGAYDFSIDVGEENYGPVMFRSSINAGVPVSPQNRALVDRSGNPLGDAIQQVGLRLEARRSPIEVIIVDAARRTPIDN